jgi:hypothetical protein
LEENHESVWEIKTIFSWTTPRIDNCDNFWSRRKSAHSQNRKGLGRNEHVTPKRNWLCFMIPWESTVVVVIRYVW